MNIAICDDQQEIAEKIYNLIQTFFNQNNSMLNNISIYHDGHSLLTDFYAGQPFNVIFLDIDMPSISGMEVAKNIRQTDSEVLIVFITSYPDFMPASFKVEAFDFLTKPFSEVDLYNTLERCIQKYTQKNGQLAIRTSLGTAVIKLRTIVYITSDKHYLNFIFNNGTKIRTQMTLNQLEEELLHYQHFARCHQSYIVNLDYVSEVQREKVLFNIILPNGISFVPISRKYCETIKEKFLIHHLKLERKFL